MKISILTLGCKTNLSESDYMKNALLDAGCSLTSMNDSPDICIINTCTVTSKSDYQSRQLIRRALRTKAEVFVTGCYSERALEDIKSISPEIKIVSNHNKNNIINILDLTAQSNGLEIFPVRSRPFVKIQDGCNCTCTYCTIPKVRGPSVSRESDDIIREIKAYEGGGYKEVVLTGIHIGHYGFDLSPRANLSLLLSNILKETNEIRIRLSSIEINEFDDFLIELLSDRRICNHLHIPLQSGHDGILESMKRPYNRKFLTDKIDAILGKYNSIALGTDVIVGFPGEGNGEFDCTRNLVEDIPFAYIHVFPYSGRPSTEALKMSNHISPEIKKIRAQRIREIAAVKRALYRRRQIGEVLCVVY
jgi:threonylcarbamoyladenosine tRNA methylthiotransferase MtaB